ncbi:MAG: dephospho-CoA kinase [Zoogloeaceae bacterium]|jgi:dephospho-CoA kinase|nr:dephospho-CoA kinase [Zoogloeaceae bacterium]
MRAEEASALSPKKNSALPLQIGVTGGIGSGKSMAADFLAAQGALLVDSDEIAHRLTAPDGEAIPALVEALGADILTRDGRFNRAFVRQRAFADEGFRQTLEAVLHPMIHHAARRELESLAESAPPGAYLLYVIPLLAEKGGAAAFGVNRVLLVDCPEALQYARVARRSGLSEEEISAIMARQASRAERLAIADDVLVNDRTPEELLSAARIFHEKYRALAKQMR